VQIIKGEKMSKYSVVLVAVLLVLMAAGAWAYPNLDGATGLVTVPTAEVTPANNVDFALDYQKTTDGIQIFPARVSGGVTDRLELSAAYAKANGDLWDYIPVNNFWDIGIKYAFMSEPKNNFGLAVGGSYGKVNVDYYDSANVSKAYAVISKNLGKSLGDSKTINLKAHAGLLWAKVDQDYFDNGTLTRPFVGLEVCGKNKSDLALEYRWKDNQIDDKAVFSAVLRYPLGVDLQQPFWLEVGTTNGGLIGYGAQDSKLFVGVAYRYAPQAAKTSGKRNKSWGY
jgi:hypothetical protein